MKKTLFFLFILPSILWAAPVDPNLAQQVAENFINAPETSASSAAQKAPRKQKRMARAPKQVVPDQQFYIFNSEDSEGFVIVAADDIAHPILGYSKTGFLEIDNMPENLRWWISEYDREIRWAQANDIEQSEEIAEEWQQTISNQIKAATPVVSPLITSEWDQRAPYNDKCPIYNGTDRAFTGCVATAVAQIMNYWKHPVKGTGSFSYISKTRGFQLSADFENSTYDWNNMVDTYSYYTNYNNNLYYNEYTRTDAQKNAVATLMSDVGIAFQMDYAKYNDGTSLSYNAYAMLVLPSYFNYDRSLFPILRDGHSIVSWVGVLGNQLDQNRPILYQGDGGPDSEYGHSFVCDGYDSDMRFHFNFGWSGMADGYFYTDALTPSVGGSGAGDRNYSYNQVAIVNIMPARDSEPAHNLQLISDLTIYKGQNKIQIDPLTTTINPFDTLSIIADIANVFCTNAFKGTLYAALYANDQYFFIDSILNVNIPILNSEEELETNSRRFTFEHTGRAYIEEGTYAIRIFYKPQNEETSKLVGGDYFANALFFTTEYSFILKNGQYVIVANRNKDNDKNWYYMTSDLGTASTKRLQAVSTGTESMDVIVTSNLENKYVWTLEADGDNWKLKNGTKYVTWTSGNSATLGSTAKSLTFDIAENKVQAHFNDGTNERYLSLNAAVNNNYFAFYANTLQITDLYFLPYDEGTTPPPTPECKKVPYVETFASSQGDFIVENPLLPDGFASIWNWDSHYGMVAKATKNQTKYESESWLLSPCIELPEDEKCVLTFSHAAKFFSDTKQMSLWFTTNYITDDPGASDWEQLTIPTYPTGNNWDWFESGEIDLSAYAGEHVVFGFQYTSTTSSAPQWEIKNFTVSPKTTTSVDNAHDNKPSASKILRDGQILILRGERVYTTTGQEVK